MGTCSQFLVEGGPGQAGTPRRCRGPLSGHLSWIRPWNSPKISLLEVRGSWVQLPALPRTSCVAFGK